MRTQNAEEAIAGFYNALYSADGATGSQPDAFMEQLVKDAVERLADIDSAIASHSEHWRIERMPAVDRNILRLAVCEMITTSTPAAVVIDEALQLARRFSGDESVGFVNGVLDAIHREQQP